MYLTSYENVHFGEQNEDIIKEQHPVIENNRNKVSMQFIYLRILVLLIQEVYLHILLLQMGWPLNSELVR